MKTMLTVLDEFLWGVPALLLILTVGIYFTVRLKFVQLKLLPKALKAFLGGLFPGDGKDTSGFQALCTALAATVGTGNLVGVAGAICLGGPGAIFWMWLCGILGMVTKFAEATLAVRFRVETEEGFRGGPMYVMERGLGDKWKSLAAAYSFFGVIAAFGIGNAAQINAVVTSIHGVQSHLGGSESRGLDLLLGILFATLIGILLSGGAKTVAKASERLVPVAAAGYILLCCGVLAVNVREIPGAFTKIILGAFSPKAVTGGMLGSCFQALRVGCARGVFTNEAGMGTAAIAHGGACVDHPVQQGMMGIVEVFLDTIVICTMTALVILVSGIPIPYGADIGGTLTGDAFSSVYGAGASVFLTLALTLFAVATILGWSYYGGRCAEYLFGMKAWKLFAAAQTIGVVAGAVLDTGLVWQLAETVNGLMVIPNLITLAALSPEVVRLTKEYIKSGR